jgi:hypothetical protein
MMGIRRVDELSTWKTSSYEGSESSSDDESEKGEEESSEFVAVPNESNVWHADPEAVWTPQASESS